MPAVKYKISQPVRIAAEFTNGLLLPKEKITAVNKTGLIISVISQAE